MGIFSRILEKRTGYPIAPNPQAWFMDVLGMSKATSGATVNEATALTATAVLACVKIISESVASLPLNVYKRLGTGGKAKADDHSLYTVLHDIANTEMTAFNFREVLQSHLLLWGNAYAEIEWSNGGEVLNLWPLRPDRTYPYRNPATLQMEYRTSLSTTGEMLVLPAYRVLHIPGFGFDGLVGYSPIRLSREAIGMSLATEEYGARFFGSGAKPGGVLEHPGKLTDGANSRLRESWNEMHQGLSKTHRVSILEEGMTYKQIGIPPEDAQFLETRKFQKTEIASIYRVPPHMIADLDKATFSNIEHQDISFVKHTMLPWFRRWEQIIFMKLFSPRERKAFFAEFMVDALLRGDIKSRFQAYQIASQNGWFNADEIREMENMNPQEVHEGIGKTYFINSASVPKQLAGQKQQQTPPPAAQPPPPKGGDNQNG